MSAGLDHPSTPPLVGGRDRDIAAVARALPSSLKKGWIVAAVHEGVCLEAVRCRSSLTLGVQGAKLGWRHPLASVIFLEMNEILDWCIDQSILGAM